jgi:hypothetical protein
MISRAGGTSLCRENTEKFDRPSSRASSRVAATAGVVVSKPMPRKTTSRSGFFRATLKASNGEYTMRISAPRLRSSSRLLRVPGTRIMSPKVKRMMSLSRTISMTASMSPWLVTHTGQPGPDSSLMLGGSSPRIPLRAMAMV